MAEAAHRGRLERWATRVTRDRILFVVGLGIFLHELILIREVRIEWILAGIALTGSKPLFELGDKKIDKNGGLT